MSVYMTEAEQLETIKKWWLRHQSFITIILSIVLLAVAGYRYWNWHMEKTTQQASAAYENMMVAVSTHDDKSAQSYANQLIANHEQTIYAMTAHLTLAKIFISQEKNAKAREELAYVAHHAKDSPLKPIATIRLSRLLLSKHHYDKALAELATLNGSTYMPVINELKGDVFSAMGDYSKAVTAYQTALKDGEVMGVYNHFLEMKLDAVAVKVEPKVAVGTASHTV